MFAAVQTCIVVYYFIDLFILLAFPIFLCFSIRRFDRRTREELMDDLSNVPLGSERRRVLTLGLG